MMAITTEHLICSKGGNNENSKHVPKGHQS